MRIPLPHRRANRARHRVVAHRDVYIQRAVRFDVDDGCAQPRCHRLQPADLPRHGVLDLVFAHGDFNAAEVGAVGITGMRSDVHPALERQPNGAFHGAFIAGVAAASDVSGGDMLHQARFERRVIEFPQVAIEIECHREYNHSSTARRAASACSMVTESNAVRSRGRNWPRRQKSAEITLAGLG